MAYPYTNAPPGGVDTASGAELEVCSLIIDRLMEDFPGPWVFCEIDGVYKLLKHSDACPTPEAAVEDLRQKILRATFWEDPALFPVGPDYDARKSKDDNDGSDSEDDNNA